MRSFVPFGTLRLPCRNSLLYAHFGALFSFVDALRAQLLLLYRLTARKKALQVVRLRLLSLSKINIREGNLATSLTLEANLGMRISDILQLQFCDIIRDDNRFLRKEINRFLVDLS